MNSWISVLNGAMVSLFGAVLAAAFCGITGSRKKTALFGGGLLLLLLLQGAVYMLFEGAPLRQLYPITAHLPLFLLLWALSGKLLWPLASILLAYMCCQLRRWLALLAAALLSGGQMLQEIVELAVTLPLILLLLYFVAPAVRQLADHSRKRQWQFAVIPALYYVFDYLARIYTDLLAAGTPAAVEFMPFVCCTAYLVFLLYNSAEEKTQNRLLETQKNLDIQLKQAVREIDALRESQDMALRYRHDLRHHLQYLSACMDSGQEEQAKNYILTLCQEIEAQKLRRYCENETANLVLSAFAGRAAKEGIRMEIRGAMPASIPVTETDLCVLLSNALENALNACRPLAAAGKSCAIDVQFYMREGKLFLQIKNPCGKKPRFEKGIPVSEAQGHGVGVRSICAIVERYKGIYGFLVQDEHFILRLSL